MAQSGASMAKFETQLLPEEERAFQAWKARMAPKDSGANYDLRGAFKAGTVPDPTTGHWPDTFKKPNHPSFSKESIYHPDNEAMRFRTPGEQATGQDFLTGNRITAAPAVSPNATVPAAPTAATPVSPVAVATAPPASALLPSAAAVQRAGGIQPDVVGPGGRLSTTRQNAAQKADQAAFDSRFVAGQFNTHAPGAIPWAGDPVRLPKPTVDSIYNKPTGPFNRVAQFSPAPGDPNKISEAAVAPTAPGVTTTAAPGPAPTPIPTPTPAPTPVPAPTPPAVPTPTAGRTTEAGVSRSRAAEIAQPTQQNPVPVTPTSPILDVNEFDKRKKFSGL